MTYEEEIKEELEDAVKALMDAHQNIVTKRGLEKRDAETHALIDAAYEVFHLYLFH